jgi:hypothetical protein
MKNVGVKKLSIAIGVMLIVAASAIVTFGQKPTRITFKRGATSTVVTGTLNGYKGERTYVIRVRKGQVLSTGNVGRHHITVLVEAPKGVDWEQDMDMSCHSVVEVDPTAAGDYKITVTECLKADPFRGRFKLKITVK